jgi:hypothetical protein
MRRLAQLLVARRSVGFASARALAESIARLRTALEGPSTDNALRGEVSAERVRLAWGQGTRVHFDGAWQAADGEARLEGEFTPARRTRLFLNASSVVLTLLLAGCAYAFLGEEVDLTAKVLLPITTAIAILAFPFVAVALGSQREAEEAQIARAVRRAFALEEEKPQVKPRQKWDDEED